MKKTIENPIIYADPQKCLGCKNCELACATVHAGCDLQSAVAQGLQLRPRNKVIQAGDTIVPMQCRQCEDAPCAHACPTGAILQDGSHVKIEEGSCVGCKLCVMVCPFGAITVKTDESGETDGRTNRGVAKKCDLCIGTAMQSEGGSCACVEACPTGAIMLVDIDEYRRKLHAARARELAQTQKHISFER
ncbi:carbon-monoxide dehydrogenase iron sulfur subunit [Geothermobacter ehrlichii]|uniref:Carbon-monoxide dehydrogenase iron sulfur subunit n=1 Tax=Geothermobacter ehrlichii TaxID=213224 RepID=A0A5D3WJT5_9BACT|nr:4Fe-4S dicluster domain-containing protein [Geothermobacter ehrlichii]TYO98567.1 carbon-monoxide dehydrogenase iron sulfur subunit [Geothermobacter ehrlichii]